MRCMTFASRAYENLTEIFNHQSPIPDNGAKIGSPLEHCIEGKFICSTNGSRPLSELFVVEVRPMCALWVVNKVRTMINPPRATSTTYPNLANSHLRLSQSPRKIRR